MELKEKYINLYMDFAARVAELSSATRLKVGAVIVNDNICVYGYNGTPSGWDNNCEYPVYMGIDAGAWLDPEEIEIQWPYVDEHGKRYALKTKPETLHAEMNALMKLAKSTEHGAGASIFITHNPCIECAKGIYQAGIRRVYWRDLYRNDDGVIFLKKANIDVIQVIN